MVVVAAIGVTTVGSAPALASDRVPLTHYVVASSSSDTSDCLADNPCATLSYAVSVSGPGDTIVVGPGTFRDNVTIPATATASGEPLTIRGAGSDATTISGGLTGSVFTIASNASAVLSGLDIVLGRAEHGGGIENLGVVTVDSSAISYNQAYSTGANDLSGTGGGIWSGMTVNRSLTLLHSTVSRNTADRVGGGIYDSHGLLTDNLISGNTARQGGAGAFITASQVWRNTITGNQVQDHDGHPQGVGGGILGFSFGFLAFNTITANTANIGGGVGINAAGDYVDFFDTGDLVAKNVGGNCSQKLSHASVGSLEDDPARSCGFDTVTSDAKVDTFTAARGGPTETLPLAPDSPAVGLAPASACQEYGDVDQRGFPRVADSRLDIGAVEITPGVDFDVATVPTLGGLGKLLLAGLLAGGALLLMRRD